MVNHETVDGYEAFTAFVETIDVTKGPYFILYTGSIIDGKSWCPDCVEG